MEEKNPFDIVLRLVAQGEIDPWNIDITILADKFLQEIRNMYIPDLKYASKVILVASILLKMKAESLKINEEEKKKNSRKRVFGIKRFYTLEEIAYLLKDIVQEPIKVIQKIKRVSKDRKTTLSKHKKTTDLNFNLVKGKVDDAIAFLEEELNYVVGVIALSQLSYPYKPSIFMALLFLNYDNKVNIYQERHFDEIYIEPVKENIYML
ncbi:MAG: segregation/condensation protein A [Hydrogenothermaceae bacterium]